VNPFVIDLSLRENVFGSRLGQTLEDKLAILPKLRAFGFEHILLGTLDYFMPDEPEVDDDFIRHLRDHGIDMTGGFVFTDIGLVQSDGSFSPSVSMQKMRDYRVPNTLHEIYLSREGMAGQYDLATLKASLPHTIRWLHEHVRGDHGGAPRILINIVDGCDAFARTRTPCARSSRCWPSNRSPGSVSKTIAVRSCRSRSALTPRSRARCCRRR
jgi:hypothetical protein